LFCNYSIIIIVYNKTDGKDSGKLYASVGPGRGNLR